MPYSRSRPSLAYTLSDPVESQRNPVVFVSGMGGVQAAWLLALRHFGQSRTAMSYDHRGVGTSEYNPEPMQMRDYAADLVRLLDEVGLENADFVGLSFGGRVLQQLAVDWPSRVRRMVLGGTSCGGVGHTPGDSAAIQAMLRGPELKEVEWLEQVIPAMFGQAFREAEPARLKNLARWWARHPPDPRGLALQAAAFQGFDLSARLGEIHTPTLILHGTEDRLSPPANALYLVQQLPRARLHWLAGVGHSPNAEVPQAFHREIEDFLDEA